VLAGRDEKLSVEPLASGHDRSGFESGVERKRDVTTAYRDSFGVG
jgi:hypothetical protein